jgi:hypothetical protein
MLYCVQRHPGSVQIGLGTPVVSVGAVSPRRIFGEPNQTTLALVSWREEMGTSCL